MEDPQEEERLCRICHGDEEDGEDGRLFRPCKCSGTMGWVHVECLDKWRQVSSNPQSFYCCDQCHHRYDFGRAFTAFGHGFGDRFTAARFFGHPGAVHLASVLALAALVCAAGFVAKLLALLGFYSECAPENWVQGLNPFTLYHWCAGSILIGSFSVLGWVFEALGMFARAPVRMGADLWGGGVVGGRGSGDSGKFILAIIVVIGLLVALHWIYGRVQEYAQAAARHSQDVVLDYRERGGGHPKKAEEHTYGHPS
jgi:hypothetical protein